MKQTVKVAKRMADWRRRERLGNYFEGNKQMFWREVKRVMDEMVKGMNGHILRDGDEVRRWVEYCQQVLNVEDVS